MSMTKRYMIPLQICISRTKVLMHDMEEPEVDLHEYITVCQPEGYLRDEHEEKLENGEMSEEDIEEILKKCGSGQDCMCQYRSGLSKTLLMRNRRLTGI